MKYKNIGSILRFENDGNSHFLHFVHGNKSSHNALKTVICHNLRYQQLQQSWHPHDNSRFSVHGLVGAVHRGADVEWHGDIRRCPKFHPRRKQVKISIALLCDIFHVSFIQSFYAQTFCYLRGVFTPKKFSSYEPSCSVWRGRILNGIRMIGSCIFGFFRNSCISFRLRSRMAEKDIYIYIYNSHIRFRFRTYYILQWNLLKIPQRKVVLNARWSLMRNKISTICKDTCTIWGNLCAFEEDFSGFYKADKGSLHCIPHFMIHPSDYKYQITQICT